MDYRDLVIEQLADDLAVAEQDLVSYRSMAVEGIEKIAELEHDLRNARRQIDALREEVRRLVGAGKQSRRAA